MDRLAVIRTESQRLADVLAEVAPRTARRSAVVHNAVAGPPVVRPVRSTPTGPLQLLYVGRLSPRKGPQVAVAALGELVRRGVDAHLTLLGSVFPGYEWFEAELRTSIAAAGHSRTRCSGPTRNQSVRSTSSSRS